MVNRDFFYRDPRSLVWVSGDLYLDPRLPSGIPHACKCVKMRTINRLMVQIKQLFKYGGIYRSTGHANNAWVCLYTLSLRFHLSCPIKLYQIQMVIIITMFFYNIVWSTTNSHCFIIITKIYKITTNKKVYEEPSANDDASFFRTSDILKLSYILKLIVNPINNLKLWSLSLIGTQVLVQKRTWPDNRYLFHTLNIYHKYVLVVVRCLLISKTSRESAKKVPPPPPATHNGKES